ncbi:hypothetical protein MMC07_002058 [Pseudocyphellaria aurata]|nr:hypothetical protein [Pseudocyphellaria aurata]
MSTKSGVLLALENIFGTPPDVIPFYAADDSGVNVVPLPGSTVKAEHRLNYLQVRAAHKHLSGPGLGHMTERFLMTLRRRIDKSQIGSEWIEMPDLYRFLQIEVFHAAVEAMCGSYLLSQYPTFVEDFWEFDRSVPTLFKALPRWMTPKPYKVRDRLLKAVKRWHKMAHENSDCTKIGADDAEWDPYFGSKLIRARQDYSLGMDFMNADARAAEDLGLIFATNTNAIPAVGWFIIEICRNSDLLFRVLQEVEEARIPSPEIGRPEFDINKVTNGPLLQSIYAETLRLRVAILVTRTPEREDFNLGEWVFPKDKIIALSSRTAAMNPNVWNTGTPEDPHPLDQFWAERFLVYPDDPASGPLRKDHVAGEKNQHSSTLTKTGPKFSMEGVAGGWIPYGGGQRICPGRHFAKQEIIGTFAMLFTHYDIELLTSANFVPTPNMSFFPFGGLPPTEKVPFRIKQRKI